ncbi:MAG: hypothetical protein JRJ76_15105 [Deltaproteobacteria bacterium]|nr:hypothetical protein [Deltaproteobacteria bacterium]MBW1846356.1 hypothetical protein [Deltaproteobacteria bacterium]MBW2179266.1 hypothetical protein [Deltaproteobacteria bacterium]
MKEQVYKCKCGSDEFVELYNVEQIIDNKGNKMLELKRKLDKSDCIHNHYNGKKLKRNKKYRCKNCGSANKGLFVQQFYEEVVVDKFGLPIDTEHADIIEKGYACMECGQSEGLVENVGQ